MLSTEIDYCVFPSSSYGSHTDALKHLNGTLEKTPQVGLVQCSFPPSPIGSESELLCSLHALGKVPCKHPSTPSCSEMSSFYIGNPLANPRSLNAKMTNVSDFAFSMLGYIYPQLSGEAAGT